jgi:2'-5' RNA ligase
MRLFVGIAPPPETVPALTGLLGRLQPLGPDLKWYGPEKWHVTLQFLGSCSLQQYPCLVECLREVRPGPFTVEPGEVDVFDRSAVLLLDVRRTPELLALQTSVERATAPCGFEAESRPFHPHLTLARGRGRDAVKTMRRLRELAPPAGGYSFRAREFVLYESASGPGGATYLPRERFPLTEG